MYVLTCIPAYNEETKIGKLVQECLRYSDHVVVCDDGSTDNTSAEAENSGALVIRHSSNKGKGSALKSLFNYARQSKADVIVTIDGDGQFKPSELKKLADKLIDDNADIVIGYRFDNSSTMPKYRKMGNQFLDRITNIASELKIRDSQSGFRAYSKYAIDKINFDSNGFGADSEIVIQAARLGLKISEEKISVLYNTGEKTSTKDPISHTSEVISSLIEHISLKHPPKYLGIPGVIITLVGIIFSVNLISLFNDTRYFSIPLTLISFGALILGSMLILIGILLFSISKTSRNRHY